MNSTASSRQWIGSVTAGTSICSPSPVLAALRWFLMASTGRPELPATPTTSAGLMGTTPSSLAATFAILAKVDRIVSFPADRSPISGLGSLILEYRSSRAFPAMILRLEDAAQAYYGLVDKDFQAEFFNKAGARQATDNKKFRQHEYDWYRTGHLENSAQPDPDSGLALSARRSAVRGEWEFFQSFGRSDCSPSYVDDRGSGDR